MCLAWARDHVTWNQNDWAPVLFTDESRFCVDFTDRRARVWRMPNERFAPVCVAEHDRFGGGSVMVWAGISAQGKTDLHVIDNGTLTALRYVNEILDVYVRPYAGAVGENFILMDDNARAHRAASPINISNKPQSSVWNWPARSPDLNPIEHAWDTLQTAVHHALCNQHLYRSSDRLLLKNGIKFHNIRSGGLSAVCGGVVRR